MAFTSYVIKNDLEFKARVREASRAVGDLRVPFLAISKDFYKSEKAIFNLKSRGKYPDIKPATKNVKFRDFGFRYPILKRTGDLEKSVTSPDAKGSIRIITKNTLVIGTSIPYGIHHQFGAPDANIPMRKFLFIGPEAPRFALNDQIGRPRRWARILKDFVVKKMKQQGFS